MNDLTRSLPEADLADSVEDDSPGQIALHQEIQRLQHALRESEARFRDVVRMSSDWYWEQDENFRATYFATEVAHAGYSGTSLLGQTRWEQPGVDLRSADFEAHRAACEAREEFRDFTYRRVGSDGMEHWICASGNPVFDRDGRFIGYRGVARDVTRHKQDERSLEQAQRFLGALIKAIPSPVLVKDHQGRYIAVNAAFCTFFQRPESQILGKNDGDFFRPEDAQFYQMTDAQALEQGEVVEYERLYAPGRSARWMMVRKCGLIAPDGRRLIVVLLLDVTQRRAAEEALRQSEARFRSLTELSADWYWEQDEQLRFRFISDEAASKSGWDATRSTGLQRWNHPGVDLSSADWEAHKAICAAHRPFRDFTYRRLSATGSPRWISVSGEPMFDALGQFKGYRGVGRDLTEQKRAEQEIARRRDFYAALSQTNRAIIHIHEPIALAQEVCRVAVEYGHFCLVWMGLLDDATGWVQALAIAGPASPGYPGIRVSIDPSVPEGRGFSGAALRDGKYYVVNDYFADGRVAPWIPQARAAGVKSMATFPLKRDGRCVGLLNLHGDEIGVFTQDLVALLEEMAANLSFALTNMEREVEREKAEQRLLQLAHYDELTELPNRALFYDRLQQALAVSRRRRRSAAVIFIDLDQFKLVNDTLGHAAGDSLLRQAARRLKGALRTDDTVARFGGDEFSVIVSDLGSADDADVVIQQLTHVLEQPFDLNGHEMFVTASLGATLFPTDGSDAETLLKNADVAMYRAKEQGRNNSQFYKPEMNARSLERVSLGSHLRRALERGELFLHYQPQVELGTGRVVGMEALLRWHHPDMGTVPPAKFIPVAEETGLIVDIGNWVLHNACAQNKTFQDAGLPAITLAVNLSARQFREKDLIKSVCTILRDTGLDPRYLELEITESMVMQNAEEVIRTLRELEGMRVQLSVDDFGTGYSSLSYLKRFPVHRLKIDQSFVRDIGSDSDDEAIAQSIIALGHGLDLKVLAEGVESAEQLAFLTHAGCDQAQGYYFSMPLPPEELMQAIADGQISKGLKARDPA